MADSANSSCEVTFDPALNRVRLWYRGRVTAAAMESLLGDAPANLARLRPGFTLVADLTGLEDMAIDCVGPVTHLMDLCKQSGVATVVRIIPDPEKDIGLKMLSLVHYRHGVRIVTCQTTAEAERVLAG